MSDYRKLHLYHINKQIAVGGDVLDAPSQTPIANLILERQGNAVTKPPSEREVDFAKQKTEGVGGINDYRQPHLSNIKKRRNQAFPLRGRC